LAFANQRQPELIMIRKLILALALGSALAASLSSVYADDDDDKKKKKPAPELRQ
jgi:hypothetical protein